jgi:O-acetyl-ADP-ribose deacetylase (regulator of RNase III)
MIHLVNGDLFDVPADIRVNAVNCVGVMGAGIALVFKQRYPEMFRAYQKACEAGELDIGSLHVWKAHGSWIVNFPTKRHWRHQSQYTDIARGLVALHDYLKQQGDVLVTIPALGCGKGGLTWPRVSAMIQEALKDLPAEIMVFEPNDLTGSRTGR